MSTGQIEDLFLKGTYFKPGIWITYITFNVIGVVLCLRLSLFLLGKKNKTSADMFTIGCTIGCIWMSISCGVQCFINVIYDRFYGGEIACWVQSFSHVSGVLTQFFNLTALHCRNYVVIVKYNGRRDISFKRAGIIVLILAMIAIVGTFVSQLYSQIYLVSNGAYCFYVFKSPAILFWLVPNLFFSLICVIAFCFLIFMHARIIAHNVVRSTSILCPEEIHLKVAKRSIWFTVIIIIGWGSAIVAAIYEYTNQNDAPQGMVTTVGAGGTFYSIMFPLVYGYSNGNFIFLCKSKYLYSNHKISAPLSGVNIRSPPQVSDDKRSKIILSPSYEVIETPHKIVRNNLVISIDDGTQVTDIGNIPEV